MPFFTPEQVAQAYIGPGAGLNEQLKLYQAQLAEQKKLDIEAAKRSRAEQMSALMDLNKTMANSKLGTGTALDEAHNQRSQQFYNKWTTGAGRELMKTDPQQWVMGMTQESLPLLAATKNYETGVKDLNTQLNALSGKYNDSLMTSPVRNALINRLKYKNNGQYPDFFQIEKQDVDDILSGRINSDGSDTKDPLQQRANMSMYFDKGLNQAQILDEYGKMKAIPAENVVNKGGVKVLYSGKISPFDRINPKENKVELDLVPMQLSIGEKVPVLSDKAYSVFERYPKMKIGRSHYEQELLQNPDMVDLKAKLNDDEWLKLLTSQYVIHTFPSEQTLTQDKQDIASQEARRRMESDRTYNKNDGEQKAKGDYWTLSSAAKVSGIPQGAFLADDIYKVGNPKLASAELYDITDFVGGKDLKNRSNFPTRILKDAKTGKTYYVSKQYTSSGGSQVQPHVDSSSLTSEADVPVEFNPQDINFWRKLANPQDYNHKSLKEFEQRFNQTSPLAMSGVAQQAPSNRPAGVPTQAAAATAPPTPSISDVDYGNAYDEAAALITENLKKAQKKTK